MQGAIKTNNPHCFSPQHHTYGHVNKNAYNIPLEILSNDMNMTVKCAMERDDTVPGNRWHRVMGGLGKIVGPIPLFFQENPEWNAKRHQDLVDMITKDEEEYGRLGQG